MENIQLDINKVLSLYKQRVSDLEHELILQTTKCIELQEFINKNKIDNQNND